MLRTNAISRHGHEGGLVRTVVVSALGLLPVGVVTGMMLMQILGIWRY
jgi:hypothetical protein